MDAIEALTKQGYSSIEVKHTFQKINETDSKFLAAASARTKSFLAEARRKRDAGIRA
jgi:hypothetical protein